MENVISLKMFIFMRIVNRNTLIGGWKIFYLLFQWLIPAFGWVSIKPLLPMTKGDLVINDFRILWRLRGNVVSCINHDNKNNSRLITLTMAIHAAHSYAFNFLKLDQSSYSKGLMYNNGTFEVNVSLRIVKKAGGIHKSFQSSRFSILERFHLHLFIHEKFFRWSLREEENPRLQNWYQLREMHGRKEQ